MSLGVYAQGLMTHQHQGGFPLLPHPFYLFPTEMEVPPLVFSAPSLFHVLRSGQAPKSLSIYSCFLDVLLVLLLVILISSMFYVRPEAAQAKNVIQINKIISDVLEHPHLPSGSLLLR